MFNPNDGKVYFISDMDSGVRNLWTMDVDGRYCTNEILILQTQPNSDLHFVVTSSRFPITLALM